MQRVGYYCDDRADDGELDWFVQMFNDLLTAQEVEAEQTTAGLLVLNVLIGLRNVLF